MQTATTVSQFVNAALVESMKAIWLNIIGSIYWLESQRYWLIADNLSI